MSTSVDSSPLSEAPGAYAAWHGRRRSRAAGRLRRPRRTTTAGCGVRWRVRGGGARVGWRIRPHVRAEQPTEDAGDELSRAEGTATAEGACHLLDVALVAEVIGIRFDIAAASRQGATYTCLLRPLANPHPELALSITATTIDATILREEVAPRGARAVKGLGKAGYQATVAGSGAQRPAVEVGWLSGDQRLISLRYTVADGEDPAELAPRLLTLARRIDAYRTE
ncbi:MAG TPA: hypothetical protein VIL44_04965 [Micromonospora sp.]